MDKYLILVNESHPLGDDYIPEDLVDVMKMPPRHFYVFRSIQLDRQCFEAANRMFAQAEKDGLDAFILISGYRTRDYQTELYAGNKSGKVAKPGCSEHETGLAMDLDSPDGLDKKGPYYKWLVDNAADFGFILRYPAGRECVTHIPFEHWHWRYVGVEAAKEMKQKDLTLEEYTDPSIVRPDPYDLGFIFMSIYGHKMKGHWQEWPDIDLEELKKINPDTVGWVYMENTPINYPILYHEEYPEYYLCYNFSNEASVHGGVSMPRLPDDGIFILSAHHMKDVSMFMKLIEIKDKMTLDIHPEIYLNYEGTIYKATWFAALEKPYSEETLLPAGSGDEKRQLWLDKVKRISFLSNDIMPDVADKILICSTCNREHNGNLELYGVMKEEREH
ncbi:MAG: D-alanyl-D-alanine carboxypeptidase family protein [Lachnospiraceae bacterium]|nr:D-alanyl-D-alanine carboxypeptidase family protein [Lachnospiraceae bacterium]